MNKTDLVNVIAQNNSQFSKKDINDILAAALDAMTIALKDGDKVQLSGFGTFEAKQIAAREGRNPQTGEAIQIAASKKISFSAFKALKDIVNG